MFIIQSHELGARVFKLAKKLNSIKKLSEPQRTQVDDEEDPHTQQWRRKN